MTNHQSDKDFDVNYCAQLDADAIMKGIMLIVNSIVHGLLFA